MDIKRLLKLLNEYKANFVIIGATAAMAHGYTRVTKDIDIFIEPTRENVEKVFIALEQCGYDIQDTSVEEALEKKLLFRQYILELDLHPHVTGITFDEVWQHKIACLFHDEPVFFSSLEDLIKMKEAANRPKDQEDLRYLREIQRQLKKKA